MCCGKSDRESRADGSSKDVDAFRTARSAEPCCAAAQALSSAQDLLRVEPAGWSRPQSRMAAIEALLSLLGKTSGDAQVDPSRTVVRIEASLWTIVAVSASSETVRPEVRRAGAKHKRVR